MKLLDLLKKLGILRHGSYKGTYRNAKEMPDEVLMDDVYDSKKDLVNKDDLKKARKEMKTSRGKKSVLFWAMLILGILFGLMFLGSGGFSFYFILFFIFWGGFLFMLKKGIFLLGLSLGKLILISILLFVLTFVLLGFSYPDEVQNSKTVSQEQSDEEKVGDVKNQKNDKISQFLLDLKKETDIDFSEIEKDEKITWTTKNMALLPTDSKSFEVKYSSKKREAVKKYLIDEGGELGTIGFTFTDKKKGKTFGYLFNAGEYKHLMCVGEETDDMLKIGCGWGPGGGE